MKEGTVENWANYVEKRVGSGVFFKPFVGLLGVVITNVLSYKTIL